MIEQERVPRLENGDRLTRAEFERRYDAMPDLKKAELIKGIVYMPSPVRHKKHSEPNTDLVTWLGTYRAATPGLETGVNGTIRLDDENVPQPDAMLRLPAQLGGQSRLDEEDYIVGAPELVIEIASSSVSYDLHDKKDIYGQHGVQEYIAWRTEDREIDWFRLEGYQYVKVLPNEEGIIESRVFPGLRLATTALLAGVLAELQKGLDSAEHKAFVERLAALSQAQN
ncbi:MAG: Uma2 family endonuclease [Acidobacteria bacterium]|nr:Uma2 family endonuclease [Acidobacteriota bacterium]